MLKYKFQILTILRQFYLDCPTLCHGLGDTAISDQCCSQQFCQCYAGEESFTLACFEGRVFCNSQGKCVEDWECEEGGDNRHCCEETLGGTTASHGSWFNFYF